MLWLLLVCPSHLIPIGNLMGEPGWVGGHYVFSDLDSSFLEPILSQQTLTHLFFLFLNAQWYARSTTKDAKIERIWNLHLTWLCCSLAGTEGLDLNPRGPDKESYSLPHPPFFVKWLWKWFYFNYLYFKFQSVLTFSVLTSEYTLCLTATNTSNLM